MEPLCANFDRWMKNGQMNYAAFNKTETMTKYFDFDNLLSSCFMQDDWATKIKQKQYGLMDIDIGV